MKRLLVVADACVVFLGFFRFLENSLTPRPHCREWLHQAMSACGLTSVVAVPVIHCYHSYGLVLTHADGWKLVYVHNLFSSDESAVIGLCLMVLFVFV